MYICYKGPHFLVLPWAPKISGPALIMIGNIFLYNFSQSINCLTSQKTRIAFFCGRREYSGDHKIISINNDSCGWRKKRSRANKVTVVYLIVCTWFPSCTCHFTNGGIVPQGVLPQLIHKNQYGFIKHNRSTQDCIAWSLDYIHMCH
jgi:hypothetical protein